MNDTTHNPDGGRWMHEAIGRVPADDDPNRDVPLDQWNQLHNTVDMMFRQLDTYQICMPPEVVQALLELHLNVAMHIPARQVAPYCTVQLIEIIRIVDRTGSQALYELTLATLAGE